jgi:hypothetical protein
LLALRASVDPSTQVHCGLRCVLLKGLIETILKLIRQKLLRRPVVAMRATEIAALLEFPGNRKVAA